MITSDSLDRVRRLTENTILIGDVIRLITIPILIVLWSQISLLAAIVVVVAMFKVFIDYKALAGWHCRQMNGGLKINYDGCNYYVSADSSTVIIGDNLSAQYGMTLIEHIGRGRFIVEPATNVG